MEITVRRINSMVSSLPLKWMKFIPFPLSTPSVRGFCIREFRTSSSPIPGTRNDQRPRMNLRAYSVTLRAFAIQLSWFNRIWIQQRILRDIGSIRNLKKRYVLRSVDFLKSNMQALVSIPQALLQSSFPELSSTWFLSFLLWGGWLQESLGVKVAPFTTRETSTG